MNPSRKKRCVLGNFIDRISQGFVVDMFHLDFINFAIFNVADSYLTVGVIILLIAMLKEENKWKLKLKTGGLRLDKALSDLTELSRSLANEQIKSGQVLVNGQVKKAKYTVQEGDIVTYHVPEPEVLEYVAEDLPLEIIYQDEDVACR